MRPSLTDYLKVIQIIRMLYGVELARQYFEATYSKYLDFGDAHAIIGLPRDIKSESVNNG